MGLGFEMRLCHVLGRQWDVARWLRPVVLFCRACSRPYCQSVLDKAVEFRSLENKLRARSEVKPHSDSRTIAKGIVV